MEYHITFLVAVPVGRQTTTVFGRPRLHQSVAPGTKSGIYDCLVKIFICEQNRSLGVPFSVGACGTTAVLWVGGLANA